MLGIVKMLVERRHDVNDVDETPGWPVGFPPPIVSAVLLEHVPMSCFLRDRGAILNTLETCGEAVVIAKAAGPDSMLELLDRDGVDIAYFPPSD